ncbi:MAG TPA: DNA-directed RNA polymerase [Methanocorpusculum sp.]|nr:DNA-directed RNA polymerase [Candidatus Methanocorpusculum equi]MCQ2357162.1 DNA-directed RNA polymerase [Methanocorpusculum sp.]MCQ2376971.1 DNA-directed RNA polymerase [Methanocorpusculum sp.]HJJ33818.1 DNA-directed RNA polymerase [Methanocorpusculum sp.]HJJ44958.1 DNA-directed RNA polymerase [Methanocorpusculum sp.]
MYYKLKLNDKVRVPPEKMGEDLNTVILDELQEQFEGSIDKEMGIFIAVTGVNRIGEGEIVYSDGGVYYDVDFDAVVLRLALQEIVEGIVVETTSFGAFVSLGPIDAMLHMSQISDEYIDYDEKNSRLVCKESGRHVGVGDTVRARVVALSLNERDPRESKIGLTMRQPGLGTLAWLEEDRAKEEEAAKKKGRK